MLSRRTILETKTHATALHRRIGETFARRDEGPKEYEAWSQACNDWHSAKLATDFLWEDSFRDRLRSGERDAVEEAILFLEVDPWFFRSGYLKQRLIRGLKACPLTARDELRLRNVIWNVANGSNRPEFRKYCSLAVKVTIEEFEDLIKGVSEAQNIASHGKLSRLGEYLEAHGPGRNC